MTHGDVYNSLSLRVHPRTLSAVTLTQAKVARGARTARAWFTSPACTARITARRSASTATRTG